MIKTLNHNFLLEIATFMGKNLSEEQLQIILEQVDFQAFRKNK